MTVIMFQGPYIRIYVGASSDPLSIILDLSLSLHVKMKQLQVSFQNSRIDICMYTTKNMNKVSFIVPKPQDKMSYYKISYMCQLHIV